MKGLVHLLALATLITVSAPAQAQAPTDPSADLERVTRDLKAGETAATALTGKAGQLSTELKTLQAKLVAAAAGQQAAEAAVTAAEAALAGLAAEEAVLKARLAADQEGLSQLTSALLRLSQQPPLAALARPGGPGDAQRTLALLRGTVPSLSDRAAALAADLADLARVQADQAEQQTAATALTAQLAARHRELTGLLEQRAKALAATEAERKVALTRVASLTAQAKDLKALLAKLEADRRAEEERAKEAEAAARQRQAALPAPTPSPGTGPDPTMTGMVMPVAGTILTRYGETDRLGAVSRGLTFQGRAGGAVVAPHGGAVVFAGPFRGYGQILILEHRNGYHSLLAGLGSIQARPGQDVEAGEPVGTLAAAEPGDRQGSGRAAAGATGLNTGDPTLYFEFRRGGQPVNPLAATPLGGPGTDPTGHRNGHG